MVRAFAPLIVLLILLIGVSVCVDDLSPNSGDSTASPRWGSLSGRILYDGPPPERRLIPITKETNLLGTTIEANDLIVHPENRGLSNVVVFLYLNSSQSVDVHPRYDATADAEVELIAENGRFHPHVLLMRAGQIMVQKNKDEAGHNFNCQSANNPPCGNPYERSDETGVFGQRAIRFDRRETRPFLVHCSIHPWMRSVVLVQNHPYMAKTDENGRFRIEDLPVGVHTFRLWHERSGWLNTAQFRDCGKTIKDDWLLKSNPAKTTWGQPA